jgi:hypothetical protein
MQTVQLLVFGARWDATRGDEASDWSLSKATGDGKRVPVNLLVPAMIDADELATYIADLLHEAVPSHGEDRVLRLPDAVDAPDGSNGSDTPDATSGR